MQTGLVNDTIRANYRVRQNLTLADGGGLIPPPPLREIF